MSNDDGGRVASHLAVAAACRADGPRGKQIGRGSRDGGDGAPSAIRLPVRLPNGRRGRRLGCANDVVVSFDGRKPLLIWT